MPVTVNGQVQQTSNSTVVSLEVFANVFKFTLDAIKVTSLVCPDHSTLINMLHKM